MGLIQLLGILSLVSFVISSIGYYKYVYFFSLGYGFSIVGIGATLLILYRHSLTFWTVALCGILMFYGLRLGGYLAIREFKSANYRKVLKTESKSGVNFTVKTFIWISVVILYICQCAPVAFRLYNGNADDIFAVVGALIAIAGVSTELMADHQKTQLKKKDPNKFASTGLYTYVRCPNYFGELIMWLGILISGINIYASIAQWTIALLGYIGITYVMFSGARRLEIRQDRNYGKLPEYQNYVKTTPILIPLLPIYSVKKYGWLVA